MKNRLPQVLYVSLFSYFIFAFGLFAETMRPEPESSQTAGSNEISLNQEQETTKPETEKAKSPPKGKLRIWLGGMNQNLRFAVGILKSGQKMPDSGDETMQGFEWLYRGLKAGSVRDYLEVPVGNYDLVILPEEVEKFTGADDEFKSPKWKKAQQIERESLRITPDSHTTAIIRILEGDLKVDIFNDAKEVDGAKMLRVFNLTGATLGGLKTIADGKEVIIFRRLPDFFETFNVPHTSFSVSLELYVPGSKPKSFVRKFYEADFRGIGSCSLVVFLDRYGRTTSLVVNDGS